MHRPFSLISYHFSLIPENFFDYQPNRKKILEIKNNCCYYSIVDKLITEAVLT